MASLKARIAQPKVLCKFRYKSLNNLPGGPFACWPAVRQISIGFRSPSLHDQPVDQHCVWVREMLCQCGHVVLQLHHIQSPGTEHKLGRRFDGRTEMSALVFSDLRNVSVRTYLYVFC